MTAQLKLEIGKRRMQRGSVFYKASAHFEFRMLNVTVMCEPWVGDAACFHGWAHE
jgi:hypothetical protein